MRKPKTKLATAQGRHGAAGGSVAFVHFEITTAKRNVALIHGDPGMSKATLDALSAMIDALAESVNNGTLRSH